ncbi:MAG: radical SAM protein [Pseudomonadota bacterium]
MEQLKDGSLLRLGRQFGVSSPPLGVSGEFEHFDLGLRVGAFRNAMREANEQLIPARLGLTVQLPFCSSLCYHCARMKKVTRNARLMSTYVDALCREMREKSELVDQDRLVDQVWFVGGSPLYLGNAVLGRVMAQIAESFSISGSTRRYFFIELDARTATPQHVAQLSMLGINALRLWVPAMSPSVQKTINRQQSTEALSSLVMASRRTSYRDVTLATRIGLPMQSLESLVVDVDWFGDLGPDNLIVERYQHRPGLNAAQRLIPRNLLPEVERVDEMEQVAYERLELAGYHHLGLGHFTRDDSVLYKARQEGNLQRGLLGYMAGAGAHMLGFGAGAVSRLEDRLFRAPNDLESYMRSVDDGDLAIGSGVALDRAQLRASFVVERILCDGICREADWSACFDISFDRYVEALMPYIDRLILDGKLKSDARSLTLTASGRKSLDEVVDCFERSLSDDTVLSLH